MFFFPVGWWTKSLIYNEKWLFHQATILRWMFRGVPVAVTAVFFLVRCGVTAIISDQGSWQERVLQAPASSVGHWSWLILASGLATKNDLKQQTPPSFLIVFVSLLQSLLHFEVSQKGRVKSSASTIVSEFMLRYFSRNAFSSKSWLYIKNMSGRGME